MTETKENFYDQIYCWNVANAKFILSLLGSISVTDAKLTIKEKEKREIFALRFYVSIIFIH